MEPITYSTAEAASKIGVHRDTLLRWLRQRRIPEPRRDHHGWRQFSEDELKKIVNLRKRGLIYVSNDSRLSAEPESADSLRSINWDFDGARTDYLTHSIHPYPAKFIPQIPNALIQELSSVGETVLDIFCGSGTSLVEALVLKRNAIGLDANPLACLISRAKTTRLSESNVACLMELVEQASNYAASVSVPTPNLFSETPFVSEAFRPDVELIGFWFEPFIIEELSEIRSWCFSIEPSSARDVALAAFSSIIVAVSKQDSDTRYVRREKNLAPGVAFLKFGRALTASVNRSKEFSHVYESRFSCEIYNADILTPPELKEPADLVICSPPYPNAYSYHLYHKTRLHWLEMDQASFKQKEIGSHRKYSRKGKTAATTETFTAELISMFGWLKRNLRPKKYACFVIGNSTLKGRSVDNSKLLIAAAEQRGFSCFDCIPRRLQATKKSFNPKIGKIRTEKIVVLRNE